jgi:hypothetical protein
MILFPCVASSSSAAVVFDLAADWSDSTNPNGPWSYNDVNGRPLTKNIPDTDLSNEHFAGPQPAWILQEHGPGGVPMAFKSRGVTAGTFWNLDAPAGRVGMHGQPLFAGITWTSPVSGETTISGGVWKMRKNIGRVIDWHLTVNGVIVTGGTLSESDPYTSTNPFNFAAGFGGPSVLNLYVTAGDIIGIEAGFPVEPFHSDFVGVDLTFAVIPSLLGDYNANGTVDAADYVVWRHATSVNADLPIAQRISLPNAFGDPHPASDLDYLVWKGQFGSTVPLTATNVARTVPEPSTLVLLATTLVCVPLRCRRMRTGSPSGK